MFIVQPVFHFHSLFVGFCLSLLGYFIWELFRSHEVPCRWLWKQQHHYPSFHKELGALGLRFTLSDTEFWCCEMRKHADGRPTFYAQRLLTAREVQRIWAMIDLLASRTLAGMLPSLSFFPPNEWRHRNTHTHTHHMAPFKLRTACKWRRSAKTYL